MDDSLFRPEHLLPRPKHVRAAGGALRLAARTAHPVAVSGTDDERAARRLAHGLRALDVDAPLGAARDARFLFALDPAADTGPEGYALEIGAEGARVVAADLPGLFYGACTLIQIARTAVRDGGDVTLPGVEVRDAPDFARRGVMLDISRDRVPTMETVASIVDHLAAWKVNELQLYMEHTFAYPRHEAVWTGASPFTPEEIRSLDAFCRERHVELVPNQNSLGHFHRWLKRDAYRALAECPDGVEHPFSIEREPFSLCPTDPKSLELLADLYDQLLPAFSSDQVNVGLDETFDIGLGRSAQSVAARGRGAVYLDFLRDVHALVTERGKRMQFWGDIILEHPELVAELPADAIAMEWGYEAGHPFREHAQRFAESGLDFYVCPGTSSWQSVGGRIANAAANLAEAARHGREAGAVGYLVTDWGDYGHWQPLPVMLPGLALGAGRAWNGAAEYEDVAALLAWHVLEDESVASGRALVALGDHYLHSGAKSVNGSPLFFLLRFAHEGYPHERIEGLTEEGLERSEERLDDVLAELGRQRMTCADGDLIAEELRWAVGLLAFACQIGRVRLRQPPGTPLQGVPDKVRAALSGELRALIDRYRELWPRRSRPGGLADSAGRLSRVLSLLSSSTA